VDPGGHGLDRDEGTGQVWRNSAKKVKPLAASGVLTSRPAAADSHAMATMNSSRTPAATSQSARPAHGRKRISWTRLAVAAGATYLRRMAHPRMYSDDDPYLADLRKVCLALPESAEVEAWGRPTFRAGKKLFAVFAGDDDHDYAAIFKPEMAERPALLEDPRFYVPAYFGPSGWLALDFTAAKVDWDEVVELMESSYRQVALKRMLKALDDRG
jgi:hypothetical protein